jgi:hypothetical protein
MVAVAAMEMSSSSFRPMLAVVLVSYVLAAPYRPALTAALPLVVGETGLAAANARVSTARQVMTFVGPLVGAAVIGWGSAGAAFVVNAATFVVAALLIGSVRSLSSGRRTEREPRGSGSTSAWGAVASTSGLAVMAGLVFVMYSVRGAELVLYALVAEDQLGLGRAGIGVLTGAVGFGALVAMPFSARVADIRRLDLAIGGSLIGTALPLAALGWISSPVLACAVLAIMGATVVVFEVLSVVVLLRLADDRVLGTVFGAVASSSNGGKLAGALLAPAMVAWIDLRGAFIVLAAFVLVSLATTMPAVRSMALDADRHQTRLRPIVDVLARLALFEGASRTALQRLAPMVAEQSVRAGAVIVREGDAPDAVYLVRSGTYDAFIGGEVVNVVGDDGWFGEIGIIHRVPRTATVVARTDGVVWSIPGDAFLAALNDVAAMPSALLSEMSERLRRTAEVRGRTFDPPV